MNARARAGLRRARRQTRASFEYQWSRWGDAWDIADPSFCDATCDDICGLTQLDRPWFAGKKVLDAGCGPGRHSVAFCSMGADVACLDYS